MYRKNLKKMLLIVLSSLIIMSIFVSCGGTEATSEAAEPEAEAAEAEVVEEPTGDFDEYIYFGVNYELTGAFPIIGESAKQGIDMAVDEINAAGGITVGGEDIWSCV